MKRIRCDVTHFNDKCSLSCIESYLLYILSIEKYSYKHLYAKSYQSFVNICSSFQDNKMQYSYYTGVQRVQETAQNCGLVELEYIEIADLTTELIDDCYLCIRVTSDFMKKRYNVDMWRDDHYILISDKLDEYWTYLNAHPCGLGKIALDELLKAYDGMILKIRLLEDFKKVTTDILLSEFCESLIQKEEQYINIEFNNIISARDAIGVMRVIRKRVYEYCSQYVDCEFIFGFLCDLDKQYSILEYMRLRNSLDYNKINDIFLKIYLNDICVIDQIREKMRCAK